MPQQFRWMMIATAVIAVAVIAMLVRGCGQGDDETATDFSADGVIVESPDLAVNLISIGGIAHPGYTAWTCLLECRESRGCSVGVDLEVDYVSSGEDKRLLFSGLLEGENGETMRIGRPQRPATVVDGIEKITIKVVSTYDPDAPRPAPNF